MKYKSKYGLNSGNSFHFGSRLQLLKGSSVRRENILLKTVQCEKGYGLPFDVVTLSAVDVAERLQSEVGQRRSRLEKLVASTIPDGGLPFTSTELYVPNCHVQLKVSLNKHKRWLLPEVIADCISKLRSEEQLYLEDCDAAAGRSAFRHKNVEADVRKRKRRRHQSRDETSFEEDDEVSPARPGVNIRVTLKHRLITSRFENTSSVCSPRHPGRPCGSRRADCVYYDDSAALPSKRRNVKSNSQTVSFARDLRHAMRPLKETNDVTSGPGESSDETGAKVAARSMRRTHTRGVQRMKTGKCKRSKPCQTSWERKTQGENLIDKTREIPEVQYEICTAMPLTSHRCQNDSSHRDRFPWHYRYNHPQKSMKKIVGSHLPYKAAFAPPMTSSDLYDYVHRIEHELEPYDDTRYDAPVNDEDEEKFGRATDSCFLQWDSLFEAGRLEQRTKAYRKKVKNVTATVEVAAKNSNRVSSCAVRRRGKGEAIYIGPDGNSTKTETANATPLDLDSGFGSPVPPLVAPNELDKDDDFIVVETAAHGLTGEINQEKAEKAFRCSVRRHSIELLSQSARYRDHFTVSRTIPRRFVLDLTERGGSNDLEINRYHSCSSPTAPRLYVVAEEVHVVDERCCGQSVPTPSDIGAFSQLRCHVVGDDVNDDVRALLKSQFHGVQIDNFADIIQTLVSSVEANGSESCLPTAPVSSCQSARTIPRFHFISNAGQWSVESCDRTTAFNALSPSFYPHQTTQSITDEQRWSLPESCEVCFRSLLPDEDGCMNGLALSDCCHWFCEDCWQQHLANAISQNRLKLQCPSYQCSNEVDRIALISLLPLSLVDRYWTYSGETGIDRNPDKWRWCANPRCQLVLHQHSEQSAIDQAVVASCRCGCTACFKCGGAPHWPSTCEQTDVYNRMKQQRGDDVRKLPSKAFFVSVKRCPSCQYPIEKNGGCPHMTCSRCTYQFCWRCRKDWLSHDFKRCFDTGVQTISIDHTDDVRFSLQFYQMAIAQRWKRVVWEDKRKIIDKLTAKCLRLQRIIDVPNVSYEDWASVIGIQQSDLPSPAHDGADGNIFSILAAAASFYLDVRFTIEYSYVSKMTSTRKEKMKHQNRLQILEFIADNVEQALFSSHGRRTEARMMASLLTRIQSGYNCMKSLARSFDSCNYKRSRIPR